MCRIVGIIWANRWKSKWMNKKKWKLKKRQETISCPVNMLLIFVFVRVIVEITWSGIQSCDHIILRTVRLFITLVSLKKQCVSIRRPLDSLFKGLVRLTKKKSLQFYITGPLWGESTGYRWIPSQRDSKAESFLCHHVIMWFRSVGTVACWSRGAYLTDQYSGPILEAAHAQESYAIQTKDFA